MDDKTVSLADGREIALREPHGTELRGIKLLDVLQMDATAVSVLVPRISDMSGAEFLTLGASDLMTIMTGVLSFFVQDQEEESPSE